MKNGKMLVRAFPLAVFAFAGGALTVGKGGIADGLAAACLALFVIPMAVIAANSVFGDEGIRGKRGVCGKLLYAFFSVFAAIAAFFIAAGSAREFSSFAADVMLIRIPFWGIASIFLGFCAYLAGKGAEVIQKFSFVAFLIIAVTVPMLFLLSSPNFEMLDVFSLFDLKKISAGGVLSALGGVFAPAIIAIIYFSLHKNTKMRPRSALLSVLISAAILLICFLNVTLLLGEGFGKTREYPYSEAVSAVSAGKLFARMEGFVYMIYYAAAAVKTAVSLSLVCIVISDLLPKRWKNKRIFSALPYAVAAVMTALAAL